MKLATECPGRAKYTVYKDRPIGHMILSDDLFENKLHEYHAIGRHN